jgi:hypothetical protein
MAYENTDYLKRKVESLRNPNNKGLIGALKDWRANKYDKQLSEAEKRNETLKTAEMQRLISALQTGGTEVPMQQGRMQNFNHPEVQQLALAAALQRQSRTNDPSDLERYMGMSPEDRAAALEFRRNPYLNQGNQFLNVTNDETVPINVRPHDRPELRGQQETARQEAITAAMPEQIAIENAGAVQRENALAVAPRSRDAETVLSILDMAEPLLQTATESGLGTLRDNALAFFGKSTEGGEAAAQLKAIGGLLTSKMPRMQGPQSNYDVQLYQEMAGKIGDSTIPVEQRLAAIKTLRELNEKYANQPSSAVPTIPGAPAQGASVIDAADEILRAAGILE